MKKLWEWIKPKVMGAVTGAGIVLSIVIAVLTLGRKKPWFGKTPPRPELEDPKDVVVPDVKTDFNTDFNERPKDDYDKAKEKGNNNPEDDIMDLNERFT